MQGGRKKVAISNQYLAIARKRLKIDRYMLPCVWPSLNPLPIHVKFTAIVPATYPGRPKCALGWLQKLTHVWLAIAILLVDLCCGQTDKQTDSKILPTPTDIVGVGTVINNLDIRQCLWCCHHGTSHFESSPGSSDKCRTAQSGCRLSQAKPIDLGCESACRLLSSTSTVAIYDNLYSPIMVDNNVNYTVNHKKVAEHLRPQPWKIPMYTFTTIAFMITQPGSWYSFYRPMEGRRLSRPTHTRCEKLV